MGGGRRAEVEKGGRKEEEEAAAELTMPGMRRCILHFFEDSKELSG